MLLFITMQLGKKWEAKVRHSRRYQEDIAIYEVTKTSSIFKFGRQEEDANLIIEIGGITEEVFSKITDNTLFLQNELGRVISKDGVKSRILLDPRFAHKVFVGGLYVCSSEAIKFGYDFDAGILTLDRDRGLGDGINLKFKTSSLWLDIADAEDIHRFLELPDLEYVHYVYSQVESTKSKLLENPILNEYQDKYGSSSVPCKDQDEFNLLRKQGYAPVMVSENKYHILTNANLPALSHKITLDDLFKSWCERASRELSESLLEEIKDLWEKK